ncbi:hypothetical protein M0805_004683 [Coniferiporia weirii]|nr:hypothetical protein M0805_004683 [Coniferiporia weirii]
MPSPVSPPPPHPALYAASVNPPRRAKKGVHGPVDSGKPQSAMSTDSARTPSALGLTPHRRMLLPASSSPVISPHTQSAPAPPLDSEPLSAPPGQSVAPKRRGRKPLGGSGPSSRAARESARRANHSRIEKARRLKINGALEALRVLVPNDIDCGGTAEEEDEEDEEDEEPSDPPAVNPKPGKRRSTKNTDADAKENAGARERAYKLDVLERTVLFVRTLIARVQGLETQLSAASVSHGLVLPKKTQSCTCSCTCAALGPEPPQTEANLNAKRKRTVEAEFETETGEEGRKKPRSVTSREPGEDQLESGDEEEEEEEGAADDAKHHSAVFPGKNVDGEGRGNEIEPSFAAHLQSKNIDARHQRLPPISELLSGSISSSTESPRLETFPRTHAYEKSAYTHSYLPSLTLFPREQVVHSYGPSWIGGGSGGYLSPRHSASPTLSASRSPRAYSNHLHMSPYAHFPPLPPPRSPESELGLPSSSTSTSSPRSGAAGARGLDLSPSRHQSHWKPKSPAASPSVTADVDAGLPTPPASGRTRASSMGMAGALAAAPLHLPAAGASVPGASHAGPDGSEVDEREGAASLVLLQMRTCAVPLRGVGPQKGAVDSSFGDLRPGLDVETKWEQRQGQFQVDSDKGKKVERLDAYPGKAQTPGSLLGIATTRP